MNNANKIRNLTDKELAMMLMCPAEYDLGFNKTIECNGEMNKNCFECTLNWLERSCKDE